MATAHDSAADLTALDIISPEKYAAEGYPHREWTRLRNEAPVFWYERETYEPFWAITKHADIVEIGKNPKDFVIAPRIAVFPSELDDGDPSSHLLTMDPPIHGKYRRVISKWFTPRMTQKWTPEVESITREILAGLEGERSLDFVADVSAPITIAVIAEMLGVPREDWKLLFRWTNESIAPEEPEFQRGRTVEETVSQAQNELFAYFNDLCEERRKRPQDDILTVVARGKVDDQPIPPLETLSYYFLLVVAGNETTRNAMTGGLLALIENPDEWRKLAADPTLVDPAVEEIVRWTTPVIQFARTATRDVSLRGQMIRDGESVCLFYASGNRDEEMFEDPQSFRVDRSPNDHVGFGRGEHVCLGAHLARLELRTMFAQLRERLQHVEPAGAAERVRSSFVGGIKRAPIRWTLGSA